MGNISTTNNVRKTKIVPVRRDEKLDEIGSTINHKKRHSISAKISAQLFPKKEEEFKLLSNRILRGEDLCQRDAELRDAFVAYLNSGKWMDKLSAFIVEQLVRQRPTDQVKEVSLSEYSVYSRKNGSNKSIQDYKLREEASTRAKYYVQLKVRDAMDVNGGMKKLDQMNGVNFTTNQLKDLLIATIWPIFVDSEEYQDHSKKHAEEHPHDKHDYDDISVRTFTSPSSSFTELSNRNDMDRTVRLKTLYEQVIHSMSSRELTSRIKAGKWTHCVLTSIQDYPLATFVCHVNAPIAPFNTPTHHNINNNYNNMIHPCSSTDTLVPTMNIPPATTPYNKPQRRNSSQISPNKYYYNTNNNNNITPIAEHNPTNLTNDDIYSYPYHSSYPTEFPIVFVNKYFEYLTQYEPNEVLGYNQIDFLTCPKTELHQIDKMKDAMMKGLGVKVAITNARKDGNTFFNFLALRPVYDQKGNYSLVVGVLYDITRQDASLQDIKMIEDYLTLVCNVLKG